MTDDSLYGRPTAAELVEAVREFLEGDVMGATEGRISFHTRVAANALAMVERELASGPAHRAAEERRLRRLGFESEEALAAAIRSGRLDDRRGEVLGAIRESVVAKVAVANPGYLEPEDRPEG